MSIFSRVRDVNLRSLTLTPRGFSVPCLKIASVHPALVLKGCVMETAFEKFDEFKSKWFTSVREIGVNMIMSTLISSRNR